MMKLFLYLSIGVACLFCVDRLAGNQDYTTQHRETRKVIQMGCSREEMTALCNDGTMWVRTDWSYEDNDGSWKQLPAIPEDSNE